MLKSKNMPTKKFKVGDEVKITANNNSHGFPIGERIRIKRIETDKEFEGEYLDGHDYWYVRYTDVEILNKNKKTSKMATTKKPAGKIETAQKPKRISPLKQYENHTLTRTDYSHEVQFGCGAVTLSINDLHDVADAMEAGLTEDLKMFNSLKNRVADLNADEKELATFVALYPKVKNAIPALNRILSSTRGRGYTSEKILAIQPNILRRIAGRKRKNK